MSQYAINLACSFCGRRQHEVERLFAGPIVYIRNLCVGLLMEAIDVGSNARDRRVARRQDADQDAVVELMDDDGLANLLEKQLEAHGRLDLTMRAEVRGAVKRLSRKG